MRLTTLTIKNFRVFGDEKTFDFADRFTVIAGINGRGKTAVLDAIRILAGRLLPQISDSTGQYPRVTRYDIHQEAQDFLLALNCNCAGIPIQFTATYDIQRLRLKTTQLLPQVTQNIRTQYGNPNVADDAGPLVVSYTTDRAAYRIPRQLSVEAPPLSVAAYRGALLNRTIDYRDLADRLKVTETPDAYADHPGLANRMQNAFHRVLEIFLDGFSNLRITENPVRLLVDKNGKTLEVFQLSDGERAFLALCTDLARRLTLANPGLENPLDGAGVVLIDELELHLHPRWQRNVVEKLRTTFPHIQFIGTTHSPFVIQTLQGNELLLLDDDVVLGSFANRGLEEIATSVLGIAEPGVSPKYLEMLDAAKRYFLALEGGARAQERQPLQQRLDALVRRYADNPAYQAFLEMERVRQRRE